MAKNCKLYAEKTCRRCGRTFTQPVAVSLNGCSGGFIDFSFCPRCRDTIRDRARACDPRYVAVGGHAALGEVAR